MKQQRRQPIKLTEDENVLLLLHQTIKLQIELIPKSCMWSNVRSNIPLSKWNRISSEVYAMANNVCEICGGIGTKHPLECHEVWIYEEDVRSQRLGHFQALCPLCHQVKHYGHTRDVLHEGDRAFNRFVEINQIDELTANNIIDVVFKQHRIRSKKKWKLNLEKIWEYDIMDIKTVQSKKTKLSSWENLVKMRLEELRKELSNF